MRRFLSGDTEKIERNNFIWNMIAGAVNAAEAVVLMFVVTRSNGVVDAGILSIAFALGNLLMAIGKYGVRNYQVTDVNGIFAFGDYVFHRIGTALIMFLTASGYIVWKLAAGSYSVDKAVVIGAVCLIYVVEAVEDVWLGQMQRMGRLDVASKIFVLRWLTIMLLFIMSIVAFHHLVLSALLALAGSVVIELWIFREAAGLIEIPRIHFRPRAVAGLFGACFALFSASFLTYYITNAPKYAIDRYLTEYVQAYFGYISMPVFVIELLNSFLYQPQMLMLAQEWEGRCYKAFHKRIFRQFFVIFLLTLLCVGAGWILGIPILSIVYGVDLSSYRPELIVMIAAGGLLAVTGYSSVLLTIMRKQRLVLANMLIVTGFALAGFGRAVQAAGMSGAVKWYFILMLLLAVLNCASIILVEYRDKYREKEREYTAGE